MIKNKTILFILLISIFMLVACKDTNKKEDDILNEFVDTITFEESLTHDLDIKTEYNYKNNIIQVEWESSNTNILSNDGKYYYTLTDEMVTLNAKYTYNNESYIRSYDFISYANEEQAFQEAYKSLNIPSQTDVSIDLVNSIKYGKTTYRISYASSNQDIITNDGKINLSLDDQNASLDITLTASGKSKAIKHDIKVVKVDTAEILQNISTICNNFGYDISHDINLPKSFTYRNMEIDIKWESKNQRILSNDGVISPDNEDVLVSLKATTIFNISYSCNLNIKAMSDEFALEKAMAEITVPNVITSDITLNTNYKYNTQATWQSSDQNILSNEGVLSKSQNTFKEITLTVTLSKGDKTMEKEFKTNVSYQAHFFNDRTFKGEKNNVHIEDGKLVLDEGAKEGYYLTD